MSRSIRIERYRDGGSIRLMEGQTAFILDQSMDHGPTYGKWLTDWPKRGGSVVEEGTPEYEVLIDMIKASNEANTRIVKTDQLPLP